MTHPHIYSSEQPSGVHYLPLKRKSICDDTHEKHQKTTIDESTRNTTNSNENQSFDPDHSTKEAQSTSTNNVTSPMETTPYHSSNTLESRLPPLPQVVRRTTRPCLLQGRTSQRQSTRNITPESIPITSENPAPRWHKQSYMLFLALRQHPWHAMSRTNLIRTAMDLDRTISTKFNYPLVFGGKTPQNSASALLTNNRGRHFLSYRPSGSKTLHFRLAFEPAHFGKAVTTYRRWMKTLILKDWPLCFGDPSVINRLAEKKKEKEDETALYSLGSSISSLSPAPSSLSPEPSSPYSNNSTISDPPVVPPDDDTDLKHSPPSPPLLTEFDEFIAMRQKERRQLKRLNNEKQRDDSEHQDQDQKRGHHPLPLTKANVSELEDRTTAATIDDSTDNGNSDSEGSYNDHYHNHNRKDDDDDDDDDKGEEDEDDNQLESICDSIPWKTQGDDDYQETSTIPTCWQDIVYVQTKGNDDNNNSSNNNNGGVYARRRLPINIPLGFYFGVPTVEDEFQLVKEEKGQATYYSLMYGRTVLDATDDDGRPFTDPLKEHDQIYCPFHFVRQASSSDKANVLFLKGKIYNQVICWTKRPINENEELLVWLKYE